MIWRIFGKSKYIFLKMMLLSFLLYGCSCNKNGRKYTVGIDPSFYPAGLGILEKNVYGFSKELLLEIAEELNISFFVYEANWDNLFYGLDNKKYTAVFSIKHPFSFYKEQYSFSDIFLNMGTALIVNKSSKYKSIEDMKDRVVGYINEKDYIFIKEKYSFTGKPYDTVSELLEDLSNNYLAGGLVDNLQGGSYVHNLYFETLEKASILSDEGLKLVSLKEENEIVNIFNEGLERLKKKNVLEKLKKKWNLY